MIVQERDILRRKYRYTDVETEVWISETLLLQICDDLTPEYLRETARKRYKQTVRKRLQEQAFLPDTGAAWRWARVNGTFYYEYHRITDQYQAILPTAEELLALREKAAKRVVKTTAKELVDKALTELYKDYLHVYPAHYSDEHVNKLARACAVVQSAADWIQEVGYDLRKNRFFIQMAAVVEQERIQYVPSNYRRLKDKIMEVLDGKAITDLIDLPRLGNSNALKYDDDEIVAWMVQMRNMPQNYTNAHIIRKIQHLCAISGKRVPSQGWFSLQLAQEFTKFITAEGRYGKNGRKGARYGGYIPIENAMFAGDCWQADGTRINFISHKGKEGKQEFLYIIAIRDVYSGDILGWHLDTKEDRWGYIAAMKMAVSMAGYTPWELVIDKFPGHNTDEWQLVQSRLEREGVTVNYTSKATGKSKIERMFGTMQTVFMQDSHYYYGEGVQSSRPYAHRSAEYLAYMQKKANREGWDFDAAWQEANRVIEAYRSTKLSYYSRKHRDVHQSPRELHQESEKPHTIQLEPWTFIELFGLEKEVTISRAGKIKTEIQRVEYVYNVQEYDTLSRFRKVALCYDMDDLSEVHLFEATGEVNRSYLGSAIEQRAVQLYGPNAKKNELGKAKKRLEEINKRRKADLEEIMSEGSEVAVLLGAYSDKTDSANAETRWLQERTNEWQDRGKTRLPDMNDDNDDLDVDVRRMY